MTKLDNENLLLLVFVVGVPLVALGSWWLGILMGHFYIWIGLLSPK